MLSPYGYLIEVRPGERPVSKGTGTRTFGASRYILGFPLPLLVARAILQEGEVVEEDHHHRAEAAEAEGAEGASC